MSIDFVKLWGSYFKEFWKERHTIWENPSHRFRSEVLSSSLSHHFKQTRLFNAVQGLKNFDQFRAAFVGSSFLRDLSSSLFSISNNALCDLVEKGFSASKEAHKFQELLADHKKAENLAETSCAVASLELLPSSAKTLDSDLKESRKMREGGGATPSMHYTEDARKWAGNTKLSTIIADRMGKTHSPRAIFLGGSTGLTAMGFRESLPPDVRENWSITCLDLKSPAEIVEQWKAAKIEIPSPYPNPFQGFPEIEYVKADLRETIFPPDSFDMIDICNCLGYVPTPNQRLDAMQNAWNLLKVGGFFRSTTATPNDSVFQELIVQKLGNKPSEWKLEYINIVGFSFASESAPLENPVKALHFGEDFTRQVEALRSEIRERDWTPKIIFGSDTKNKISRGQAFLNDVSRVSPLTFGSGIATDSVVVYGDELTEIKYVLDFVEVALREARKCLR